MTKPTTAGGCPRQIEVCPFAHGGLYCGHWDVCCDLADMARRLKELEEGATDRG